MDVSNEEAAFLHETLIDGLSHVDYLWIIEIFVSAGLYWRPPFTTQASDHSML